MLRYTLCRSGNFYKGNLHSHSTVSDGSLTPAELKTVYKENGYSFLAVTDHNVYGIYTDMNEEGFLMIPGVEIDCRKSDTDLDHVVGIGHPDKTLFTHGERIRGYLDTDAQTLVDLLNKKENLAIYAHPFWSYTPLDRLVSLRGLLGVEIFNFSCEQEWHSGAADYYYEHLWNARHGAWCFATDDAHGHVDDYCGGYITVKCENLTYDSLFAAIEAGSFTASYARRGEEAPQILDFTVEDGVARVRCSECDRVCINADRKHYKATFSENGRGVTYAEYALPEGAVSVKAICIDERRNVTWSQPISLI